MDYTSLLLNNQWYLFYLSGIMIAAGYAKDLRWFAPAYRWILANVKSKRGVVALISTVTGVLPITGRVTVSAGFLDTIAPRDKKKRHVFGIIDYLSTHHYYLWSPLEKSVIIPMAALGISYWSFLGYMAPLLITAIGVIIFYIFYVLDEADVEINTDNFDTGEKYLEKNPLTYVNWGAVALLAGVIILGNFAKGYTTEIKEFVEMNAASFGYVSVAAFLGSFALGSSSRFAAITAICVSIYGVQYLPWFFAIDYAGYMLSPAHKCLSISKMYFGTPIKDYYLAILVLCGAVLISAIVTTLIV
jgi:hypothetical protein